MNTRVLITGGAGFVGSSLAIGTKAATFRLANNLFG